MGEGQTGSAAAFTIDVKNANGPNGFELLVLESLSLGSTIEDLLGETAASTSFTGSGVLAGDHGLRYQTPALAQAEKASS